MPQPEIVFRQGLCSVSIFASEYKEDGKTVVTRFVVLQRRFRDKNGEWQISDGMRVNDIPKTVKARSYEEMVLCLNKAYEYLISSGHEEVEE